MPPHLRRRFIVFEGIDGSGTTVQSQLLYETLREWKFPVYLTAEPSQGIVGKLLREILGGKTYTYLNRMNPEKLKVILALLFTADRADHVWTELEPHWENDEIVICDRYSLSTLCYELGELTDRGWIEDIGRSLPTPDLTLYLRLSADQAFDRLEKRWAEKGEGGAESEIFEKRAFQEKLVENYDAFCGHLHENESLVEKHNIKTVDASGTIEQVSRLVLEALKDELHHWGMIPISKGTEGSSL